MADTYLTRTPSSAGNRKTWTVSVWCKFSGATGEIQIYLMLGHLMLTQVILFLKDVYK